MKMFAGLSLMLLSLSAFAIEGNEGPHGAPGQPSPSTTVLAEMSVRGGLRPPSAPREEGVRIYADGVAVRYSDDKIDNVLTLAPARMVELNARVEELTVSELVDEDAGTPECLDTPYITYTATQASGQSIEVARRSGCHTFYMQNGQGYGIRGALDAVTQLSIIR